MWPSLDRYNSALHQPESCFADRDLQAAWPQRDRRGLPVPMAGAFGGVYRLDGWGRSWAVKCFTRDSDEWRYTEVCGTLKAHPTSYLVQADYLIPRGILVDERWYPVLKMEWAKGVTLDQYLDQQRGDPLALEALAARWVEALAALEERGIAHGDLQHGNILVAGTPERPMLKLVDYDAMYVPGLAGEEATETGLPDYQHPRRGKADFNGALDNFAALVIYISLRALALQPDLWPRYHADENLLLRRGDFRNPADSALFAELRALPDARLRALVETLAGACAGDNPTGPASLPALVTGKPTARRAVPNGAAALAPVPPVEDRSDVELPVVCGQCGEHNRAIARFCRGCGRTLPADTVAAGNKILLPG